MDPQEPARPRGGHASRSAQGDVERVYSQLQEWLMDAVLPPGMFLSEPDLAERCRISRTPVREACMRLLQDRWLTRYPGKGFLVTPISVTDIEDLYEYRKVLEAFAVTKVAGSISAGQLTGLRALLGLEQSADADVQALVPANEAFHLRLAELAGNVRVREQLGLVLRFARRLDTLYLQVDRTWISHEEILAAFAQRDAEAARVAMADHLDQSRTCLVAMFSVRGPQNG